MRSRNKAPPPLQEWDITHADKPQTPFNKQGAAASRKMDAAHAASREALEAVADRSILAAFFDEQAQLKPFTNIAQNMRKASDDVSTILYMLSFAIVWDALAQPGVALSLRALYADMVELLQTASDTLHDLKGGEAGALRFIGMLAPLDAPPTENCWGAFGPRKRMRPNTSLEADTPEPRQQRRATASGATDAGAFGKKCAFANAFKRTLYTVL